MSTALATTRKPSLVERFAGRYNVDPTKLLDTLKATAFKQRDGSAPSNEQMMALLVVADNYSLNPFTKEIYAFQDRDSGIVPVVGVDGWNRICNEHPQYDGVEFRYSENMIQIDDHHRPAPEWCEAVIYRKDRSRPIVAREYLDEVYRPPFQKKGQNWMVKGPWQTHTKRFLRHKALIQCARIAFGFAGIYDEDEAEHFVLQPGPDGVYTASAEQREERPASKNAAKSKMDALAGEEVPDAEVEESAASNEEAPEAENKEPEQQQPEAARYSLTADGSVIDTDTGEIVPQQWVHKHKNGSFVVAPAYEQHVAANNPEAEPESDTAQEAML